MQAGSWLRSLVWTDYRLAVLFTVIIPLILLIWALVRRAESIQRLLMIYWRVASLLAITVYLLIASLPIGFASSLLARILIPISLWFWVDLNEDIRDQPQRPLKLAFTSWRWAVTIYCILSSLASLPYLSCAFSAGAIATPSCQAWLEPPFLFRQIFHSGYKPGFLGFFGVLGLAIYIIYLSYFVLIRLGKQGRSAIHQ